MSETSTETFAEASNPLALWVGKCITEWANAEAALFEVFHVALGAPRQRAAFVYFELRTMDARMRLTDALIKALLANPDDISGAARGSDPELWKELFDDFTRLKGVRNQIAHRPLIERNASIGDRVGAALGWFELGTSPYEVIRRRVSDPAPLRQSDLEAHLIGVNQLIGRLDTFRQTALLLNQASALPLSAPPPA